MRENAATPLKKMFVCSVRIVRIWDAIENIEKRWETRVKIYEQQRALIEAQATRAVRTKKQEVALFLKPLKAKYDEEKKWLEHIIGLTVESDVPELDEKWTDEKWLDS